MTIFGHFDSPEQTEPAYDPGLGALCPHCLQKLSSPLRTLSLMKPGDARSYFYRTHRACDENASPIAVQQIESSLIDGVSK